jgi:hypothetical protein
MIDLLSGSVPIDHDTFDPLQALLQGKAIRSGNRHYMLVRKSPTKADWWYLRDTKDWNCDHNANLTDDQIIAWWANAGHCAAWWELCDGPK